MTSIANIIPDAEPLFIVDIGAALHGEGEVDSPYKGLIDSGKARLVSFEPDEKALRLLKEKYPPPHVCLPYFVGDGREATFYETNFSLTGSLFEPNIELLQRFNSLAEITQVVATHQVQTYKMDDIGEIEDVDFLKIDVQGAEQMIFESSPRLMSQATVIHTELTLVEMYKGMPAAWAVDKTLRDLGFVWHTRVGAGYRAFLPFLNPDHLQSAFNQELWCDAVYVRDWSCYDELAPSKLIKLAVVMHDIYHSYDLAHVALLAADKQLDSNYAENYAKWLSE